MAVRSPLFLSDASGTNQIAEGDSTYMTALHEFAGYAFAQNPNPSLEVQGANGSAISGQPFVDTFYVAGAYSTRVDRFATEAETANIVLTTENYSRIRQVTAAISAPSGDANNHEYPLYLYNDQGGDEDLDTHLRAMTITDFYDTFVAPVLTQFGGGGQTAAKGGTYFLTTSTTPSNASLVSTTPVAVNKVSDTAAYTASGIPEAVEQTIDTNYYLAKVDYPATAYPEVYDQLPLYWDFANNRINAHTPTTWANLMNKFLRYYLSSNAGGSYQLSYNVDGSDGVLNGVLYTDERRTPDGSAGGGGNYQQLYVGVDDYRTQEFPTGTTTVVQSQSFKIHQGTPSLVETVSLEGTTSIPKTMPSSPKDSDGTVRIGFKWKDVGNTFFIETDPVGETELVEWLNTAPNRTGNYYIRGTIYDQSDAVNQTTQGATLNTWWAMTTTPQDRQFEVTDSRNPPTYDQEHMTWKIDIATDSGGSNIVGTGYYRANYQGDAINLEGTSGAPEITGHLPLSDGSINMGWRFTSTGVVEDYDNDRATQYSAVNHVPWARTGHVGTYYIRATDVSSGSDHNWTNSPNSLGTWWQLNVSRSFFFEDNSAINSYVGRNVKLQIDIATDAAGSNIIATGYYMSVYEGGA